MIQNEKLLIILLLSISLIGCASKQDKQIREQSKSEILATEKAFEQMLKEKGASEAFSFYAAEAAVIAKKDTLLRGKEAIRKFYQTWQYSNVSLTWTAEFVDAAESGELGYTYGPYRFSATDRDGKSITGEGYFHTVWKKQADGNWRFVWD